MSEPMLHAATALHGGLLAWSWEAPATALSSAAIGGGLVTPDWLVNVCVSPDFSRTDLDAYVAEIATDEGLVGEGVALLTAVDVERVCSAEREGVAVHATVGVSRPTWRSGVLALRKQSTPQFEPASNRRADPSATAGPLRSRRHPHLPGR